MKPGTLAAILIAAATPTVLHADEQDDKLVRSWLARQMVVGGNTLPLNIATVEAKMRGLYVLMTTQTSNSDNGLSRMRAQKIARILEKDLDNDGSVTTSELRQMLTPQAAKPLRAETGLQIAPTKEQSESILQQLLDRELVTDANKDGTIDFGEMRQAADQSTMDSYATRLPLNLGDPMVVRVLDTSGDKLVSDAEFIEGVRATFKAIDADKNGTITRQETRPYLRRNVTTF